MQVRVNGEAREIREGLTIAELLREIGLEGGPLAVEHNREFLEPDRFADTRLREGDALEIVRFVGGG